MTENCFMNRLPGPESKSRGQETAVFGSLALAGLSVIALALSACMNFVHGSDGIAAALAGKPCATECREPAVQHVNLTNMTSIESHSPRPAARPDKV
jgi:hypothetical protein